MTTDEKLLDIAIAYYMQHKTQSEIAAEYGVSHVQIGKYLKEAKRRNIVTITVNLPLSEGEEKDLNRLFTSLFPIKNLVLVQGSENTDKSLVHVVQRAKSYLLSTFPDNITRIGFGWGKTMHDLSLLDAGSERKKHWRYYPVCVLADKHPDPYYDTAGIVKHVASNWGGEADPSFLDRVEIAQKTENMEFLKDAPEVWGSLNALVCGLGCSASRYPEPKKALFGGEVFGQIGLKNLVGDILHNFYDIEGHLYSVSTKDVLIPKEIIKDIPWVIAVACGFPKVESIVGGLRTGLVDTLVTDVQTARHVIEWFK